MKLGKLQLKKPVAKVDPHRSKHIAPTTHDDKDVDELFWNFMTSDGILVVIGEMTCHVEPMALSNYPLGCGRCKKQPIML